MLSHALLPLGITVNRHPLSLEDLDQGVVDQRIERIKVDDIVKSTGDPIVGIAFEMLDYRNSFSRRVWIR